MGGIGWKSETNLFDCKGSNPCLVPRDMHLTLNESIATKKKANQFFGYATDVKIWLRVDGFAPSALAVRFKPQIAA